MTDNSRVGRRLYLAERILASYSGQASGGDVFREFIGDDYADPVLEELLDLFEHEPAKSRFFGFTGAAYDEYVARVRALAAAIAADPNSVPDTERGP